MFVKLSLINIRQSIHQFVEDEKRVSTTDMSTGLKQTTFFNI